MISSLRRQFPDAVRALDEEGWRNLYVVGDVHGCADEMEEMLDRIAPASDELVLFAGDLVRRGPDSPRCVELVMEHENVAAVRGNNDVKILDGRRDPEGLGSEHIEEMAGWPLAASYGDNLVTHAGYDPTMPLAEHRAEDLFDGTHVSPPWGVEGVRVPWFELHAEGPRILFGHVPAHEPIRAPRALGLDTACVYGGTLTALDVGRDRLMQVPARRTHRTRRVEKYYDAGRPLVAA